MGCLERLELIGKIITLACLVIILVELLIINAR